MKHELPGLHHITAIASDPQQNVDFYTGVLGLRLVKITINYDDPGSYHFYYGDEAGTPGSILTFFAWPGGYPGKRGTAQATTTSFSVPEGSLGDWQKRFDQHHVRYESPVRRWDEEAMTFFDPDGLQLELVAHLGAEERAAWSEGPIPVAYATRGFHSVTLSLRDKTRTANLLTETMGFQLLREEGTRSRYIAGEHGTARTVDVLTLPDLAQGSVGVGSVHHVAWRTPTDAQQKAWQETLLKQRYHVSQIMDRQYFHSIYFREPGGVLFEIATDRPGFVADEPLESLGTQLRLPEWMEPNREQIQKRLLKLTLPQTQKEAV
ncbi:MAG: ring-cleaving dioxygenase [Chthonomonadales bacterium]|nr:ring-cleaving dioxygenase [Chthonomonadales bacterium]